MVREFGNRDCYLFLVFQMCFNRKTNRFERILLKKKSLKSRFFKLGRFQIRRFGSKTDFFEKICEIIRILKFSFSDIDDFSIFSSKMVVLKFFFTQNWVKLQKKLFVKSPGNCDVYFEISILTPKNQ